MFSGTFVHLVVYLRPVYISPLVYLCLQMVRYMHPVFLYMYAYVCVQKVCIHAYVHVVRPGVQCCVCAMHVCSVHVCGVRYVF